MTTEPSSAPGHECDCMHVFDSMRCGPGGALQDGYSAFEGGHDALEAGGYGTVTSGKGGAVSWEVVVERSGANVAAHAVRGADSRLRDVRGFEAHRRAGESGRRRQGDSFHPQIPSYYAWTTPLASAEPQIPAITAFRGHVCIAMRTYADQVRISVDRGIHSVPTLDRPNWSDIRRLGVELASVVGISELLPDLSKCSVKPAPDPRRSARCLEDEWVPTGCRENSGGDRHSVRMHESAGMCGRGSYTACADDSPERSESKLKLPGHLLLISPDVPKFNNLGLRPVNNQLVSRPSSTSFMLVNFAVNLSAGFDLTPPGMQGSLDRMPALSSSLLAACWERHRAH
ncbi:hypothetical protein C8R44DRAFT_735146 [Mycena epipterygia]|nr:hypothetical protein C8R44DRAFT_735146 [Mycena epipterygia]